MVSASTVTAPDGAAELVLLYCQSCLALDAGRIAEVHAADGWRAQLIVQPCASLIEISHLLKLLERGAAAVVVVSCPEDRCEMLAGVPARRRVERAQALLAEAGLDPGRLIVEARSNLRTADLQALAEQAMARVKEL